MGWGIEDEGKLKHEGCLVYTIKIKYHMQALL